MPDPTSLPPIRREARPDPRLQLSTRCGHSQARAELRAREGGASRSRGAVFPGGVHRAPSTRQTRRPYRISRRTAVTMEKIGTALLIVFFVLLGLRVLA